MSKVTTLRLTAFDTLFFRESRPFESIGGSELASVFPPPPRTVLGAIRAAIGDAMGVNWQRFNDKNSPENQSVRDVIGYGDDLGKLSLNGIWLSRLKDGKHERLYPAPLYLLRKKEGESAAEFERLRIGKPTRTHLGNVRLPALPADKFGFKPLENHWVTASGLNKILADESDLTKDELISSKELFERETRLGIARDNETRIVQEGLLYQSSHVRPKSELSLEVELSGVPDAVLNQQVLRLGAEGRMAGLEVVETLEKSSLPTAPTPTNETKGLIITFLTPARFADGSWVLPGFTESSSETKCWTGEINGIALTLHAAVIGKALREGGWDMAQHKPRDMQSFIPAGSSYYCTVNTPKQLGDAINKLHGKRLGEDAQLGRGLMVCGLWNKQEFMQEETA
ncbi:MAG: type III-B CRISPR module-associated protein Cmr3 [Thiolinea sp.]